MGIFNFRPKGKQKEESAVFQQAFEETFSDLALSFFARAKLLVSLYDAFKAGVADNGMKDAAAITGLSTQQLKPLLDRTWRVTHANLQWLRIREVSDAFPYLVLDVPSLNQANPECVKLDGIARRVDDPYWDKHGPVCERIDCMCRVIQMNDRQVERNGITVLPPLKR